MAAPHTKFKPHIISKVLIDIAKGCPYQLAAEKHGIHESTFRKWRDQGLSNIEQGIEDEYSSLVRSLREVECNRVGKNVAKIRNGKYGHKGAEWELERSFWKYFTNKAAELDIEERLAKLEDEKKGK